ncbi:MAG: hypothetical protein RLZZ543_614 [Bacteroidota bacterium]|jgi:ribonuclease Z
MAFELTILGCGSATPTLSRNPTAQHIRIGHSEFLVDCGEGTQLQMLRLRCKTSRLKAIFISHLHGDHFFGLPGLLSTMHLMGRRSKITIFGPASLQGILDHLFEASETDLRYPIEFIPTNPDKKELLIETGGYSIYSFPLNHRIPCTGFLFQEKPKPKNLRRDQIQALKIPVQLLKSIKNGADYTLPDGSIVRNEALCYPAKKACSYAFCSDTAPHPQLLEDLAGVEWMYHETTFLQELSERAVETFHSTTLQAAQLAKDLEVKHLLIGHYSSRYYSGIELQSEAATLFPDVIAVEDGMNFTIS